MRNDKNADPARARMIADGPVLCVLLLLVVGCVTHNPKGTETSGASLDHQTALHSGDSSEGEITAAVVQNLGSPQLRQKKDIELISGKPVSEEKVANHDHYVFLSYLVRDWNEHLYILFHNEDLLGYAREQGKTSLRGIIKDHARVQGDRIVLYQSSSERGVTYYIVPRARLAGAPQWARKSKATPPVSATQAEQLAAEWLKGVEANIVVEPKVRELLEVKSVAGAAFYIVTLWMPERGTLREVVVLMDGSVIAGEAEAPL